LYPVAAVAAQEAALARGFTGGQKQENSQAVLLSNATRFGTFLFKMTFIRLKYPTNQEQPNEGK